MSRRGQPAGEDLRRLVSVPMQRSICTHMTSFSVCLSSTVLRLGHLGVEDFGNNCIAFNGKRGLSPSLTETFSFTEKGKDSGMTGMTGCLRV